MLEVTSHNYVKRLLKKKSFQWEHNLTLTRIVSRSLRRREKVLIRIENCCKDLCWLGLLTPLCIDGSNVILVLSSKQRHHLIQIEVPKLRREGLALSFWEGSLPPPKGYVWLMDYGELVEAFSSGLLLDCHLIFLEAKNLVERMRDQLSLEILPKDWDALISHYPLAESSILQIYERISRRLYSQLQCNNENIRVDNSQLRLLRDICRVISLSPSPWEDVFNAVTDDWISWGQLHIETLSWTLYLQPLQPLTALKKLWREHSFLMVIDPGQEQLLLSELQAAGCSNPMQLRLGEILNQKPIPLFVPNRQPLPNTPFFSQYVLEQCRRLILGRSGMTIILLNDATLRYQLTSQLAGDFGLRVVHEKSSLETNAIICCKPQWWINHQHDIPLPDQLVFPLIPFPSLSSPLIVARIDAYKQVGRDWFREFLLPEALSTLMQSVEFIRNKDVRLSILDGRICYRSWGKEVFRTLEPWTPLEHLLPD